MFAFDAAISSTVRTDAPLEAAPKSVAGPLAPGLLHAMHR
jgi:hypothetical protein